MRYFLKVLPLFLLALSGAFQENPPSGQSSDHEKLLQAGLDSIAEDDLKKHVTTLADDSFGGRAPGTAGDKKTADYISGEFQRLKLKPVMGGSYFQTFSSKGGKTQNIIGLLEGSDANLKDTYVVVGGHHDHLGQKGGKGGDGIYNGADDNASGASAVVEVAEAFVNGGLKPRRSILFMTFGAEEQGYIGSKHYVANPPFPLAKHAAMINMDMVGRDTRKPIRISGVGTAAEWDGLLKKTMDRLKIKCTLAPGYTGSDDGSTDHESFARRRVPVCNFFTGYHADYHKVSDHADKISYAQLKTVTQMAFLIAADVADLEKQPAFTGK